MPHVPGWPSGPAPRLCCPDVITRVPADRPDKYRRGQPALRLKDSQDGHQVISRWIAGRTEQAGRRPVPQAHAQSQRARWVVA